MRAEFSKREAGLTEDHRAEARLTANLHGQNLTLVQITERRTSQ